MASLSVSGLMLTVTWSPFAATSGSTWSHDVTTPLALGAVTIEHRTMTDCASMGFLLRVDYREAGERYYR